MIRGSKLIRRLTCVIVLGMLLLCIGPMAIVSVEKASAATNISIKLNGQNVKLADPALVHDGRIYVPAARIAMLLGANVSWDNDNEELTIDTDLKDTIIVGNGVPAVYFNDVRYWMDALPFSEGGRLYVSLRTLAEVLHAGLQWDAESGVVELTAIKPAVITEEYSLDDASKDYGLSGAALLGRNGLDGNSKLMAGTKLKVVIPSFLDAPAAPFTQADLRLLAKITMVEAGYESYEGQLAVANVILNRVKDPRFPDTIKGVIYAGKQFPPAHNGLLDKTEPNASSIRAAKDALNGKNNVKGAVYFFNPEISTGPFWSSLDVVATIGNHSFAK